MKFSNFKKRYLIFKDANNIHKFFINKNNYFFFDKSENIFFY